MKVGGAGVYEKHANIIIKDSDDCSAQDILDLSRMMATAVHEKFDIELIREAQLLGDFDDAGVASSRV
jgi:UDP-N-acetylenolpyruvoylglucosamine reductase